LFNSQTQVDESVLDEIPQKETKNQLDKIPCAKEDKSAINGMAYDKEPEKSGVTTDMIRNIPEQAFNLYIEVIQNFWQDEKIVFLRLLSEFKEINPTTQFSCIGCQEALHIIKRALLLRRNHGLESYAVFIDLVKAFDTVNHKLMCQILCKYGLPPKLVANISKPYKDFQIRINIGKTFIETDNSTRVHKR
jgi:hypothetical protein